MKNNVFKRLIVAIALMAICTVSVLAVLVTSASAEDGNIYGGQKTNTFAKTDAVEDLLATANHYVVVKMKSLGGSHYAYTEAVSDSRDGTNDIWAEYNFNGGSQLVILSVLDNGDGTVSTYEKVILDSKTGVVRDPSVSLDGTKVLYSYKANTYDDFHIYEMDLKEGKDSAKQLTFGSGRADIEPQYLANGNIVFSSTRDVQTIDCWITPVSNLYIMNGDGSNIRRVGYDQVHTTFPTVTEDGRVIYTRWDYNDRTQMYVQGVFQMFQDGSNQTEVWGNNASFPTTLLHTRSIPGSSNKYVSIASGHHVHQQGKLCIIDTATDRNVATSSGDASITFAFPDGDTNYNKYVDGYGQSGRIYKYPYALNETTMLVSSAASSTGVNTPFSIYLIDLNTNFASSIELVKGTDKLPATQIVPIQSRNVFNRPSMVNYSKNTGTYYVADVYEGDSMEGVERGTVEYLRVVELVYRSSSIGATISSGGTTGGTGDPFSPISTGNGSWDVKAVLGIVPVESDGSVMFSVPSDTPIYFQLLDKDGCVVQTMRSWSTLMPGETFSCVGCHEDKNTAPLTTGKVTEAMKKGVQTLQPDLWMAAMEEYTGFDPYKDDGIGFSYTDTVQEIFDKSCVSCHNNTAIALDAIDASSSNASASIKELNTLISSDDIWILNGKEVHAPFGTSQKDINTVWTGNTLTLTKDVVVSQYQKDSSTFELTVKYKGKVNVKIGDLSFSLSSDTLKTETLTLTTAQVSKLKAGSNKVTVTATDSTSTKYFSLSLGASVPTSNFEILDKAATWKYVMSSSGSAVTGDWTTLGFDDSAWKTGKAPFGDRGGTNTSWTGSENYIWLRQNFTLTEEEVASLQNGKINFDIFYDDSLKIYINGKQVLAKDGWNDAYAVVSSDVSPNGVFKAGENVIAVSLHNTGGGRQIDLAMYVERKLVTSVSEAPFALTGDMIDLSSNRMRRAFPLSYLYLTGSKPYSAGNQVSGVCWKSESAGGKYVKWISTMSQAEILDPYSSGSSKSALIDKLREGHGNLTDAEIRTIACWIDLAVPCYGSYDDEERFAENEHRAYTERENKRHFYDVWDAYSKMELGGILPSGTVEVSFTNASGTTTQSGNGYVIMNLGKYASGNTVTIKVTGSKYVAFSLNERQGEALVYCPNGEFTYTIPKNLQTVYNATYRGSGNNSFTNNTLFVRIPTADELAEERNLAYNPYDLAEQDAAFPHASGSTVSGNTTGYGPSTAIDGFVTNKTASANYPYQAWTPTSSDDSSFKLDFGREVVVNTLKIKLRAASSDTHIISATLTFSDGTKQTIDMWNTSEFMTFDLGGKTVTSITLGDFDKALKTGTFAITELEVYGTEKN